MKWDSPSKVAKCYCFLGNLPLFRIDFAGPNVISIIYVLCEIFFSIFGSLQDTPLNSSLCCMGALLKTKIKESLVALKGNRMIYKVS